MNLGENTRIPQNPRIQPRTLQIHPEILLRSNAASLTFLSLYGQTRQKNR